MEKRNHLQKLKESKAVISKTTPEKEQRQGTKRDSQGEDSDRAQESADAKKY